MKILKTWAVINAILALIGVLGMLFSVDAQLNVTSANVEWVNFFLGVWLCSLSNLSITGAIGMASKGWD